MGQPDRTIGTLVRQHWRETCVWWTETRRARTRPGETALSIKFAAYLACLVLVLIPVLMVWSFQGIPESDRSLVVAYVGAVGLASLIACGLLWVISLVGSGLCTYSGTGASARQRAPSGARSVAPWRRFGWLCHEQLRLQS